MEDDPRHLLDRLKTSNIAKHPYRTFTPVAISKARPMYIDVAIKSEGARSNVREQRRYLVDQLLMISKAARALTSLHLAEIDLEVGQDQFLHVAGNVDIVSTSEVSSMLNVRPSTVSKMADRLVAKGLVERASDGRDARRTLLRLTPDGMRKRDEVHAAWDRIEEKLTKYDQSLGDEGVARALDAVDSVLRRQLQRLR